jgi:K+/H+ antiporter YhaU regulatory subunit KhtT
MEDIEVVDDSPAAGKTVADVKRDLGLTVLAVRKPNHRLFPKPDGTLVIASGDELIVLGARKQLEQVEVETD